MYYLLYSKSQKAYSCETLEEMISNNIKTLKDDDCNADYIVVGFSETYDNKNEKFKIIKNKLGRP
jgi:hypothetical protein